MVFRYLLYSTFIILCSSNFVDATALFSSTSQIGKGESTFYLSIKHLFESFPEEQEKIDEYLRELVVEGKIHAFENAVLAGLLPSQLESLFEGIEPSFSKECIQILIHSMGNRRFENIYRWKWLKNLGDLELIKSLLEDKFDQYQNRDLFNLIYDQFGISDEFISFLEIHFFSIPLENIGSKIFSLRSRFPKPLLKLLISEKFIEPNSIIQPVNVKSNITVIEASIRENDVSFISDLLSSFTLEEIKFSEEHYVYQSDIHSCFEEPGNLADKLQIGLGSWGGNYNIHYIDFEPLVIVQNGCSAFIRLIDGAVYELKNTDGKELRKTLLKEKYGQDYEEEVAEFEVYSSPGHGFMSLICHDCGTDSSSVNRAFGLYPRMDPFHENSMIQYENSLANLWNSLLFKAKIHYQKGWIADEEHTGYKKISEENNHPKIKFLISKETAEKINSKISILIEKCKQSHYDCYYNLLFRNCVNFIQEVFRNAGLSGDYRDFLRNEQIGNGYFDKAFKGEKELDAIKAHLFAFVESKPLATSIHNLIVALAGMEDREN